MIGCLSSAFFVQSWQIALLKIGYILVKEKLVKPLKVRRHNKHVQSFPKALCLK